MKARRLAKKAQAQMSKAVKKVLDNTSESPSKRTSVVKQVAAQCGIKVVEGKLKKGSQCCI